MFFSIKGVLESRFEWVPNWNHQCNTLVVVFTTSCRGARRLQAGGAEGRCQKKIRCWFQVDYSDCRSVGQLKYPIIINYQWLYQCYYTSSEADFFMNLLSCSVGSSGEDQDLHSWGFPWGSDKGGGYPWCAHEVSDGISNSGWSMNSPWFVDRAIEGANDITGIVVQKINIEWMNRNWFDWVLCMPILGRNTHPTGDRFQFELVSWVKWMDQDLFKPGSRCCASRSCVPLDLIARPWKKERSSGRITERAVSFRASHC